MKINAQTIYEESTLGEKQDRGEESREVRGETPSKTPIAGNVLEVALPSSHKETWGWEELFTVVLAQGLGAGPHSLAAPVSHGCPGRRNSQAPVVLYVWSKDRKDPSHSFPETRSKSQCAKLVWVT